ncbi:MAG: (Fe-S)-binding protein, partial [Candidatus Hadarchaeia archaeon]
LRGLVIQEGNPPAEVRDVLENIYEQNNPQGEPRSKRDSFTKNLEFEPKNAKEEDVEVLLFVGSVASYEEESKEIAAKIARILNEAGVNFGILGNEEVDSGWLTYDLGEYGLFEELAEKNLEMIKESDPKEIVFVSPHDYSVFRNRYPTYLGEEWEDLDVSLKHYTEYLKDLVDEGKLEIPNGFSQSVAYHDSCELGRRNQIFDAPRKLLEATGADLKEMELSRRNSFCCGGGGGLLWYEPEHEPKVENERVNQALETDAEILAVACPICRQMLEDGAKSVDGEIEVMDIAEVIDKSISQ